MLRGVHLVAREGTQRMYVQEDLRLLFGRLYILHHESKESAVGLRDVGKMVGYFTL